MSRAARAWTAFGLSLLIVLGAMGFFTVRILLFERSMAEAQARAALEENIRLALWRLDSAAGVLLAAETADPDRALAANRAEPRQQLRAPDERYQSAVQEQISRQEYGQRSALNSVVVTPGAADWRSYEPVLLDRIKDLLPGAGLEPASDDPDNPADTRRLAVIPARLVVPDSLTPEPALPWNTPVRVSLMVAWACVLVAGAAAGRVLWATLALSERRAAFASAVTHELRTPLTTFRMYAEMLQRGMIREPDRAAAYLGTLVSESDRLGHMIENVLAYSRLEKRLSARSAEPAAAGALLDAALPALQRRTQQAGVQLGVEADEGARAARCRADPVAVQQILFNLVDNACKHAGTDVRIGLACGPRGVLVRVEDRGPGLGPRAARAFEAFNKARNDAAPGIGLGLHLSRRLARELGGDLWHEAPANGPGAVFVLGLQVDHEAA